MWTRRQLAEIKSLLRGNAAVRREAEFDARDEALAGNSTRVDNLTTIPKASGKSASGGTFKSRADVAREAGLTSPAARGSKGGKARAGKLTPAERSAAASRAAKARWRK